MEDAESRAKDDPDPKKAQLFFLVGPPRSGTKLLKGILDHGKGVAVAPESHIYPKLFHRFADKDPFEHRSEIIEIFERSLYMERLRRNGYRIGTKGLVREGDGIPDVVRRFIHRIALEKKASLDAIGDKTPSYSSHLSTLHTFFPDARLVAIVRDPRDRALSIKSSWGKSIEMAAFNWRKPVRSILRAKKELDDQLHLIRYEELLEYPKRVVKGVCEHIGIPFDEKMLKEADSNENLGSVRSMKGIEKGNKGKYWTGLSRKQIRKVERILLPEMQGSGYEIHFAEAPREPNSIRIFFLRVYDLFKNVLFHIRHKGWKRGLSYLVRIKKDKRN